MYRRHKRIPTCKAVSADHNERSSSFYFRLCFLLFGRKSLRVDLCKFLRLRKENRLFRTRRYPNIYHLQARIHLDRCIRKNQEDSDTVCSRIHSWRIRRCLHTLRRSLRSRFRSRVLRKRTSQLYLYISDCSRTETLTSTHLCLPSTIHLFRFR